jgi:endonuclease/exonuclease/phosphatase family metal-dependent hydrolase
LKEEKIMHRIYFALIVMFSSTNADISDSVIPIMEKVENAPLAKYSENYIHKTNEALTRKSEKIRAVTFNVLFNLFDDTQKERTHTWPARLPLIVEAVNQMNIDIFCVQETYPSQIRDLDQNLSQNFAYFAGTSTSGEINAIFYNHHRFELITETISQSLDLPMNAKDEPLVAKVPGFLPPHLEPGKQLMVAQFYDRLTKKTFVVMNTHLTYFRLNSREDQAQFIADLAAHYVKNGKHVILTGDFNTFPNRPDLSEYQFYDGTHICHIFEEVLKDTQETALLGHVGPLCTSIRDYNTRHDRPFDASEFPGVYPDHIYVSPEVTVMLHAIEPCQVNHQFPSDHFPVIADILLPD